MANVTLLPISKSNKLPNTCSKATAFRLKASKICVDDHDEILEEINRRDRLGYDEASSEDDSDESASSSDNERTSDQNDDDDDISD